MGEGHVAKWGDNMMAWENFLPTFDFSFRADSKPSSSTMQPPSYPCLLLKVFFSLFFSLFFFPFYPNLSSSTLPSPSPPPCLTLTQVISHQCHLNTTTTAPTLWPLQLLPHHPLWACQPPAASTLTHVMGTHKPPHCRHPYCA